MHVNSMEVISGLASASQLLAYSHSTFQVLVRLYKQVKDGTAGLKQQTSSLRILLTAVDSLHKRPAPAHIITTLLEISKLAAEAIQLIAQSQKRGLWGLRWAAVRNDPALSEVFASLREYREILHFAVSIETRQAAETTHEDSMKMRFREKWGSLRIAKNKVKGNFNLNRVGNGPMRDGEVRRVQNKSEGDWTINDVGCTENMSKEEQMNHYEFALQMHGMGSHSVAPHQTAALCTLPTLYGQDSPLAGRPKLLPQRSEQDLSYSEILLEASSADDSVSSGDDLSSSTSSVSQRVINKNDGEGECSRVGERA
ncbi:hypothetical protein K458DRAFT_430037 [Lentithecium fluviatile CBS 122367]|uniref:Uncharacterized protein n=1 Tax=Lentithecium fluviatile CBS 122367 TaxID=1168545 RepID=A0A6G1J6L8_9PLEO|nr:hypothetical protein K458DRAFT_430037 [Lentithecium fluviatile CBS 122367]